MYFGVVYCFLRLNKKIFISEFLKILFLDKVNYVLVFSKFEIIFFYKILKLFLYFEYWIYMYILYCILDLFIIRILGVILILLILVIVLFL